jgi:predicted ATPase/class 3 adenylate cyclase
VKNLVPHFIHDQFREGRSKGAFEAYTMFIDLSGFTPLTEGLMHKGHRGAEQLSEILNEIFAPLVELVYARGGFIPYFAGDAFTAIFSMDDPEITARHFLKTAIYVRNLFSQREFKFGDFTIGLKIGLSCGEVEWGIVGVQHKSYYFRGRAIDSCANAQTKARNQDIILDEMLRCHLKGLNVKLAPVGKVCHRLEEDLPVGDLQIAPASLPPLSKEVVLQFLPSAVAEYNQEGEFRTVIAVFISFGGVDNHELLDRFATLVLEQIYSFSGYFKEIDFGDKGGVMVGFFGAPVSFENNMERALEFIHAVRDKLRDLQQGEGVRFRAGITIGTAYTGIVGGRERCQYAAVGNRVNLAARLMTYADWGEVLVDAEIHKHRSFGFQHRGDIEYKGIKGVVPTFRFVGRNTGMRSPHTGRMVGRSREIQQLFDFARPLFKRQPAGIAFVFGEAGIGKSRLTYELKNMMMQEGGIGWHVCQADQILRKPFNPFVYFLKNFFQQTPEGYSMANLNRFETRFQQLLETVRSVGTPPAEAAAKELVRTRSVLAALIGINYPDSLWEQLDAKGRYQNTLQAVINLLEAGSIIEPLVIELEDAHWLDENSEELLHELLRHLNRFPIFIIITSRYRDDGTKPEVIERSLLDSFNIPWLEIDLNVLQPESVREMAEANLNGKIEEEFYELLVRTTNSNPFYVEQLLEYFAERNLLIFENSYWNIKDKDIHLSSSMNAILTARIDRLSILVRETVKAAAVIGREFEVPILSEVMKEHEGFAKRNGNASAILEEQIHQAERGQIWLAMNELRYIFRHSLLREAAYSMQLRVRLQQVHLLIAKAIERLYADKIEERYVDLAFHYEQAGVFDKTCEYLRKAADYARRNYQNHQALDFYERLLEKLSQQKDISDQIQTHLKRGKILEMIGQWDECEEAYKKALKLTKKTRDALLLGHANNNLGRLLMLKGNYSAARGHMQKAVQLFESIEDRGGIAKVYGNLGNLYFRQGKYDDAKSYFKESISMEQAGNDSSVNAQIAANLGLTYMNQGDYDEGIRCQNDQLEICKKNNDKQGMATLYTFIGIVYLEKGDYDAALNSFRKGLEYSEELGNKMLTSIAIGQIGLVYERKGDYDQAMQHYQHDLELCEELGDKQGTAIALGLIGQLLNVKGEFHRAIEYLQKDLMLCEELGYQKGIAKAVNTLGDVFYLTREYDRSLHFYNRAIEVTRSIGNKLVLGFSLVEKGMVLIELGRLKELRPFHREALTLARELGNPDLLFEAELLSAKVYALEGDKELATEKIQKVVSEALSEDQQAAAYYELWFMHPSNSEYRQKALDIYRKLYNATPRFVFRQRIQNLEK